MNLQNVTAGLAHKVEVCDNVDDNLRNFTHDFYLQNVTPESDQFCLPDFPVNFHDAPSEIGGRLSFFFENYKLLTDNQFLLNVIRDGYKIKFIDDIPPPLITNAKPFYLNLPPDQQANLDLEMQNFIDNRVLEPADPSTPGYYSPVFLREKRPDSDVDSSAPKKYRVIHDLSELNKRVVKYKFKMDSMKSVRLGLKTGMYFYSIDIKSAYNHLLIHPTSRKYLRCWWKGQCYQFRALPFGLSSSPWIFTSIMAITAKFMHKNAVYSFFYLDDIDIFHELMMKLLNDQPKVLLLLQCAGWVINFDKSRLPVVQRGIYIGMDIDLTVGLVFPTQRRWRKLLDLLHQFLQIQCATAQRWAQLLGVITCLQDLTPLGRLQARALQFHLNMYWKNRKNLFQLIPVTDRIKLELTWWTDPLNVMCGTPLCPGPITEVLTTDASLIGFGGVWRDQELSGVWLPSEAKNHINYLEALSVFKALQHWQHHLLNANVLVQTDNTVVVCHINKSSGCHNFKQHQLIRDMLVWCHHRHIQLTARHLPGRLNNLADQLSRKNQVLPTEWTLDPAVIQYISLLWEKPNIDLFATRWNRQLPLFVSPVLDHQAYATDALSLAWDGLVAFAFPPFSLVPKVLDKIRKEKCVIFLVAPAWPRQAHFPLMLDLLVDYPLRIPPHPQLLRMPRTQIYHQQPHYLNLHVFKLSSMVSLKGAFLHKLQNASATDISPLQQPCMRNTGNISYIGVNSMGLKIPCGLLFNK